MERCRMTWGLVVIALAASFLASCGSDDDGGGGQARIDEVLADFRAAGNPPIEAVLMDGQPPTGSGGPTIIAPPVATVPDATTQSLVVTADEPIETLTLAVPGTDGYWVLNFGDLGPGSGAGTGTEIELLVTFAADPPLRNFDCVFSASDAGGAVGPNETTTITIDTCTVEEFCNETCSPAEAASCLPFCEFADVLPPCALDINAPAACDAVTECIESDDCSDAGECAESATDGLVDAACGTDTCEAVSIAP
jgi:hypothetical protein